SPRRRVVSHDTDQETGRQRRYDRRKRPGRRGSGRPASPATTASAALALGAADVQIGTASRVSDRRRSGGAAQCCRGCWTRRLQPALRSKHEILIDECHQWLRAEAEIWDEPSPSSILRRLATEGLM